MPANGRIEVNEKFCKACGLCVETCPQNVLGLSASRINAKGYHPVELIQAGCTGCGICAIVCPEAAIAVYREIVRVREPEF
ncbi:MAG: 4Fe-4S binding protein [Anaerolineaceae bacterium]|nr:4Fe-4S binding protein [Anaerolineaceae bacterium]